MDFHKIISTTKSYLFLLLKSYEKCIYEKIHDISKYVVIPSNTIFNSRIKKLKGDWKVTEEKSAFDSTIVDSPDFNCAGIPHLDAIGRAINKKIEVYNENERLICTIGKTRLKESPLRVQFHKQQKHYTHLGCREPFACAKGGMCLYNCISDQTETDPYVLKALALEYLKFISSNYSGLDLCLGGAAYNGQGARDAARYLDDSQGIRGYKFPAPGHPRQHASNPNAVGIEAYSFEGRKSGFNSYEDQDFVAHFALNNTKTKTGMDALNAGSLREVVHLNERELSLPRVMTAGTWVKGERVDTFNINIVTIVMQHHDNQFHNPEAPVFIQTFYPRYN